jgi:hypothetical protein
METVSLISQAPLEDIERWFDRAIDAKALSLNNIIRLIDYFIYKCKIVPNLPVAVRGLMTNFLD